MKVLVISDIHGSSYYAKKIKEINKKEEPDKIIVLGDLYYHGPRNELTQEYENLLANAKVSFEGKEMEEPCGLCGNVCSSPWRSACLLSFGTFPYFQGIPWNGGSRRVYQCFQYPGTNTVFCRTV